MEPDTQLPGCDPAEALFIAEQSPARVEAPIKPDLPKGVPPLRSFYLYLTTGCNLCCRHCWITPTFVNGQPQPGDCVDLEQLRDAIETAKPMGLRHVKLTGGEPMLHPQFREVAMLIREANLGMDMETNGTLIDADAARFLYEKAKIGFISVSLDSVNPASHDAFRGVKGAFDRAVNGIRQLVAVGYRPQVIMSPHHGNINEVDDMVKFATGLGAGSVKFNPVTNAGRGHKLHEQGEALNARETRELIRYVNGELQQRSKIRLFIGAPMALLSVRDLLGEKWRGVCNVESILGLLGTGHMAMCGVGREVPELTYGKLGEDNLREVWINHPGLKKLRTKLRGPWPGICDDCVHAGRCRTGCLAMNYLRSGNLIAPSILCLDADEHGEFPQTRRRSF